MDLSLLLDNVLPNNSVLYKDSLWQFYKSEEDFNEERDYMTQTASESFHQFLERVVEQLMKDEENDEERLVATDYEIYSRLGKDWAKKLLDK